MAWVAVGSTVAGAVVGGLMSNKGGSQTQTTTQDKSPWKEAQPYILDNLKKEAGLQKHYEQNPFNPMQQQGYNNLNNDTNNFRNNVMPGLMQFANLGMTNSYSRDKGLTNSAGMSPRMQMPAFSTMPSGSFGAPQVNFNTDARYNPNFWQPSAAPAAPAAPVDPLSSLDPETRRYLEELIAQRKQQSMSENFGGA